MREEKYDSFVARDGGGAAEEEDAEAESWVVLAAVFTKVCVGVGELGRVLGALLSKAG